MPNKEEFERRAEEILSKIDTQDDAYKLKKYISKGLLLAYQEGRDEAIEEWCRWAVRRMCYWKEDDLKQPLKFREGIEKICSDICVYFRGRSKSDRSPYLERQAIEYAMQKIGMGWNSNRTRLDFYEYFEKYIKERVDESIRQLKSNAGW